MTIEEELIRHSERIGELSKTIEDLVELNAEASRQCGVFRKALEAIRDEDYRGNRHVSHLIAKKALEEIK